MSGRRSDSPTDKDPEIEELHQKLVHQQQSIRALTQGLTKANNRIQALESYLSTFSDKVLANSGTETIARFSYGKQQRPAGRSRRTTSVCSGVTTSDAIGGANTSASVSDPRSFGNLLSIPGGRKTRGASVVFQHPISTEETVERNPDKAIRFDPATEGGRGIVQRRATPKADRVAQQTVLEELAREEANNDSDAEADAWREEEEWLKRTATKTTADEPRLTGKSALKVATQRKQQQQDPAQKGYSNKQNKSQQENPQFELSREMATFFLNAKIGRARRDAEFRKEELEMADRQKSLSELERLEWLRLERLYGSERHKLIRQLRASMTGHYQNILQEQTTNIYPAAPLRVDNGQFYLQLAQEGRTTVELTTGPFLEAE